MRAGARAGPGRALHGEWTKTWTLPSAVGMLAAMPLCTVAVAVFVGVTGSLAPDDTVLGGSLTGAPLAQLLAASFGVLAITGEFASGTIRATLAAIPRRAAVLAAKAAVTATLTFAAGLAGCVPAHLAGLALLAGQGHAPGRPWPALLGVAACMAVTAVLGLALGAIVRHTAGALTTAIAVILVPPLLAPLLGGPGRWVGGASPMAALQKLAQTSDAAPDTVGTLAAWPSLGLVTAATAVLLLAGCVVFARRDS